jgi:hypothetical protein
MSSVSCSVGDPDPQDLHVFVPPVSRSTNQRYGTDPDRDPSLFS